ncbi:hypothetical protein [Streptomyces sp. 7N604]|uniref:hypothetical protein n=1 Tax=Streptomyces sp. 7N604 TaxID=3457415 RepID=UPI003FCF5BAE
MSTNAVERDVDALMLALEDEHGRAVVTRGGVGWLQVQQVPIRRLMMRMVRRLHSLREVPPASDQPDLVAATSSPSFGYVTYDATEAGISYVLGSSNPGPPDEQSNPPRENPVLPPELPASPVCAVSWTSRHVETLLPVLVELAARGVPSAVMALATEADQRFPDVPIPDISLARLPGEVLAHSGGPPVTELQASRSERTVVIGRHEVLLDRVAQLATQVLARSAGCTQPSWTAAAHVERWLDHVLEQVRPGVLLCSNDTSPLGVLAVRAAERAGAETVYVQHGAWVEGQVPWRAQHCRHIAVMGARDVFTARTWTQRPDARSYVVGQPRFDTLTKANRGPQRSYLEGVLKDEVGVVPQRIAVWACQPSREQRILGQLDVLLAGIRRTGGRWGLVIAPHPAQSPTAFTALLDATGSADVAVAAPEVGARGCLAGADALISASSTCGIEAMLLDVPVLELALPAARTLELAEYGAAQRCTSGEEITMALARIDKTPQTVRVPAAAKASICLWDGRSTIDVADIVIKALAENTAIAQSHGMDQR